MYSNVLRVPRSGRCWHDNKDPEWFHGCVKGLTKPSLIFSTLDIIMMKFPVSSFSSISSILGLIYNLLSIPISMYFIYENHKNDCKK